MSIGEISSDEFFAQFLSQTSFPTSVFYNGHEITLLEAQTIKEAAHQRVIDLMNERFSADEDTGWVDPFEKYSLFPGKHLYARDDIFLRGLSRPFLGKSHFWSDITKFCKKHKKAILIALAVAAVAASIAAAIIYGTSAAGGSLAAVGGAAGAASDDEEKKKEPASCNQTTLLSEGMLDPAPSKLSVAAPEILQSKPDIQVSSSINNGSSVFAFLTPATHAATPILPTPAVVPTIPLPPLNPNNFLVSRLLAEQVSPNEIKTDFMDLLQKTCRNPQSDYSTWNSDPLAPFQDGPHISSFSEPAPVTKADFQLLCAKESWTSSTVSIQGFSLARGKIGLINGINTSFDELYARGEQLSMNSGHYGIEANYNASHGAVVDASEAIFVNYQGYSAPAKLLIENWQSFAAEHKGDPDAKYLQFCHSQGALHVKNALEHVSREIRDRIIVVAIAPAAVVPKELCHDSFNYASKGHEFVVYGEVATHSLVTLIPIVAVTTSVDVVKDIQHLKEIIWVEPAEGSPRHDHAWDSETFVKIIDGHVQRFVKQYIR